MVESYALKVVCLGVRSIKGGWLILIVNLMESKITWEKALWTCLWRITLIILIDEGRLGHCGWHHCLTRTLYCIKRKKYELQHAFIDVWISVMTTWFKLWPPWLLLWETLAMSHNKPFLPGTQQQRGQN